MNDTARRAFIEIRERFRAAAPEWGGIGLLLRVLPADRGAIQNHPPFGTEEVYFNSTLPGEYPTSVLRANGQRYILQYNEYGAIEGGAGTSQPEATLTSLHWFGHPDGLPTLRDLAERAGDAIATLNHDSRAGARFEILDPFAAASAVTRWLTALFAVALRQPPTAPFHAERFVVTRNGSWTAVPVNRADRRKMGMSGHHLHQALTKDPMDDYVVVLPDAFEASVEVCTLLCPGQKAKPSDSGLDVAATGVAEPRVTALMNPCEVGYTTKQLREAASIAMTTFQRIREAAGIKAAGVGDHGRLFSIDEVRELITTALNTGGKQKWRTAGEAWAKLIHDEER